mmetsp:Transcript_8868/g.10138  ORF Transcript_8868/g.10138 Transcript_8868/m.10138 type:complete len:85 (+) Transcript_8868:3808-4062(+)
MSHADPKTTPAKRKHGLPHHISHLCVQFTGERMASFQTTIYTVMVEGEDEQLLSLCFLQNLTHSFSQKINRKIKTRVWEITSRV